MNLPDCQEQDEPVAWMNSKRDMTYIHGPYNADDIALYIAPQQRAWVDLTEAEMWECESKTYIETCKALIVKLKVKNNEQK